MNLLARYSPIFSPETEGAASPAPSTSPGAPPPPSGEAAAPSTSSTPESTTPSPALPKAAPEFGGLGEPMDEGDTIEIDTTTAPPIPAEAKAAELAATTPAKPAASTAAPVAEVKPVASPEVKPAEAAPSAQQAAQSSVPADDPRGLAEQLVQHEGAILDSLAATRFALSKEEAEALEVDAVKAVPRLMAKAYYQATQSALLHIQNFVPRMVVSMVRAIEDQRAAETAFYGKFKGLDKVKHERDVNAFFSAFAKADPQRAKDDLLAMTAAAVAAKFGIPLTANASNGAGAPAVNVPQAPPFVPARPGVSARVVEQEPSPFAGLGQEFDDDA